MEPDTIIRPFAAERPRLSKRVTTIVLLGLVATSASVALAAALQTSAAPAPEPVPASGGGSGAQVSRADDGGQPTPADGVVGTVVDPASDAAAYWTEERMRDAKPYPIEVGSGGKPSSHGEEQPGSGSTLDGGTP